MRPTSLTGAREDVRAEPRLVLVDTDPPHAALSSGRQRPEAAFAGDVEDDAGSPRDLVWRDATAAIGVPELYEYVCSNRIRGLALRAPARKAGDEAYDGADIETGDASGDVRSRAPSLDETGEISDHEADLPSRAESPSSAATAFRCRTPRVTDQEPLLRVGLGCGADGRGLVRERRHDEVVALARELLERARPARTDGLDDDADLDVERARRAAKGRRDSAARWVLRRRPCR